MEHKNLKSIFFGLTKVQRDFVKQCDSCQSEIANHIKQKSEVMIMENNEVSEAGYYALQVCNDPEFWIDCFENPQFAINTANLLGLRVRKSDLQKYNF